MGGYARFGQGEYLFLACAAKRHKPDIIFQLLHLHPLTLEDIVQREQREKLEVFPGLGYYFVVFRAVEPYHPAVHDEDEAHHRLGGSEPVIAVTVYLVVFREGICSVRPLRKRPQQRRLLIYAWPLVSLRRHIRAHGPSSKPSLTAGEDYTLDAR